ncbi:MAG: hypothetical protein HYS53_02505 [Candidatus Aenigmarchaeota archaeon]|nr:hypothetical protein [Candidatus Aenigmarchaeota archaeon]
MKGSVNTFMGSIIMVMIGVGIIWWFRSVIPSEAFIVSERHKESFSTINYAELARKTLEEAVLIYSQTGPMRAGSAGGLDNLAPQKDGTAIWKTPPSEDTIKDTLKRYIDNEIASLQQHSIAGKFLAIDYGDTNIQVVPDNSDFSKSEKFYVKGDKEVKISKALQTQAITIVTDVKGYIDQEVKLKYFALYNAAKQFLDSGEPVDRINEAFASINTGGTKTKLAPKCTEPVSFCNSADPFSSACPLSEASEPTASEVLAMTDYSALDSVPISGPIPGVPFAAFNAKFEKHGSLTNGAGYALSDATLATGSCSFSCNYNFTNPCKTESCTTITDADGEVVENCVCVPGEDTKTQTCSGTTKTKSITFTFLADVYGKYSSEDPGGFVPSKTINNIPSVAKPFPYETLKFNYMTHSCTIIKNGQVVSTELKNNAAACSLPAGLQPV